MTEKRARLRFEMKKGILQLSKLTDIETGLVIPVKRISFDFGVDNLNKGDSIPFITVVVPIEEFELDGILAKIKGEE